jgi:ribonucleotide reductase beta subunit family protein with ferritin-like domain
MKRYTVFPIKYPDLWELYKNAVASFWTAEEIDLSKDLDDWENLNDGERHFISTVLAFFAASDGIVYDNIVNPSGFINSIDISEARAFYAYQGFNENIHGETYSLMIDKLIRDPVEKDRLFNAIENVPCVRKKADWAIKWFSGDSISRRLFAFICVEGVFFSGSFCSIFWLKNRKIMPGLCFSNELISRDEGLHQNFAIELMKYVGPISEFDAREIIQEAVQIEKEFITEALPVKLVGIDSVKMCTYIEFVSDRIMKQLGFSPVWNSECPFDWMQNISLEGKTNFFEKRVGDYSRHLPEEGDSVRFDEDF